MLLPTSRNQKPLGVLRTVLEKLFRRVVDAADIRLTPRKIRESASDSTKRAVPVAFTECVDLTGGVVWGRPPRLFANEWPAVEPYVRHRVLRRLRDGLAAGFGLADVPRRDAEAAQLAPVRITLVQRNGQRAFRNDGALLGLLRTARLRDATGAIVPHSVSLCCDGLTFAQQVRLMAETDLLMGVHGAGLLHALHVGIGRRHTRSAMPLRRPLVVHIASRRLNYHEQTIIERLVLATEAADDAPCSNHSASPHVSPRFMTTRAWTPFSDGEAAWQHDFTLPALDIVAIADRGLRRYLSGE